MRGKISSLSLRVQQYIYVLHMLITMNTSKSWSRSIFHIMAEWDFATCTSWYGPRIGIFYDKQITGKRVFDISMVGGYFGLDINWAIEMVAVSCHHVALSKLRVKPY